MKALILVAGKGERINSEDKNKCMITINNKPILEYNLMRAYDIPYIDKAIIIIGYKGEGIKKYFGKYYHNLPIRYILQKKQKGIINAIGLAREEIGDDDFFLLLGDELLINSRHLEMVEKFICDYSLFGLCGIVYDKDKESVRKTYSVKTKSKRIIKLVEKPKIVRNKIKGTGHCVFRNRILSYINDLPINKERKESDFVSLVQISINDGKRVEIFNICDKYFNINTKEDLFLAKQYIE